jgi:hypothetical protein
MPSSITINSITGTSPYNVYLCDTGLTTCIYIDQITNGDLPYTFQPPIALQYTNDYIVKIIDSGFPCAIITPPNLRTLSPCSPIYFDSVTNEIYSFSTSTYTTSSYFTPTTNVDSMTRNDDTIWIYDSGAGYIFEYDTTAFTTPSLIRQIDTLSYGVDIYGMCPFTSTTELLILTPTGDIQNIDISTNYANSISTLYNVGSSPGSNCNLLRDNNIGITYIKTGLGSLKSYYDDGTIYSSGSWPAGTQTGFFRNPDTSEIYGVSDTGNVYFIQQPPGSISPILTNNLSPNNSTSLGVAQSDSCIPDVVSFKMSVNIQNVGTAATYNSQVGFSSNTFSWVNWGDSNKISGGTNFGFNTYGGPQHKYTSPYVGDITIYTYNNFDNFKKLVTSFGYNLTGITAQVSTNELKKITGLEEYYNFGFGYYQLTYFSGSVSDFPTGMTKILANRCNPISGNTSDFPSNMNYIYLDGTLSINGNFSSLPTNLDLLHLRDSPSTLSGTTLDLPRYLTDLYLFGGSKLSGSTYDLPSGLTSLGLYENNTISGITYGFPSGLTLLNVWGNNTISDNTLGIPRGVTNLDIRGYNTISGDTSGFPSGLTINSISGNNTISGDTSGLPRSGNTTIYGFNTISGDISGLPNNTINVDIRGNNTISGDTSGLPNSIQYLTILQGGGPSIMSGTTISGNISGFTGTSLKNIFIGGVNTISGNTSNIPTTTSFNSIILFGNNTLTGDITNIPPNITELRLFGQNTIGGDISGLNTSTLRYFDVAGNNTISGGFSGFPTSPGILVFSLSGGSINLTPGSASGMVLPSGIGNFTYYPTGSGLSSADVDSILFAATAQTSWVNPGNGYARSIDLRGANSTPTASSLLARQALTGSPYNLTVYTN